MDNTDLYWDDKYFYEPIPDFDEYGNLIGGDDYDDYDDYDDDDYYDDYYDDW